MVLTRKSTQRLAPAFMDRKEKPSYCPAKPSCCPTCGQSNAQSLQERHANRLWKYSLLIVKERELLRKSEKALKMSEVKTASLERQHFSPSGQVDEENHNKSLEKIENGSDKLQDKRTTPTAAELRAMEAEKRAAWRQARMKALEEDAIKAQVVIAQVKALSSSSLEGSSVSDTDRPTENSLFS